MNITMTDKYPSRKLDKPTWTDRKCPIVYAKNKNENILSNDDVKFFEENGFIIFNNLFSNKEVNQFNEEFIKLCKNENLNNREEYIKELGSNEVRSIFSVHKLSELYNKLSLDPRIKDKIEYLLDDDTYIHQSRINAKPGFNGKEFYWHSDFETWHVEDGMPHMRAISCLITLSENKTYNGSLMVIPKSHKTFISCVGKTPENHYLSSLKKQEYGVPDKNSLEKLYDENGIKVCECPPGSVILFDCNLMHGSNGNITPLPRKNIFFVFNAVSNRLTNPFGVDNYRPNYIAER